ncbi:leucine-rich repeat-containing protein 71 [Genypterus blacodes]|uniref:leucine-rich repeat-containing protein 71 n=1 Tax=Genypterus blacodes TaxID=154954 RepID=UPI003F76D828
MSKRKVREKKDAGNTASKEEATKLKASGSSPVVPSNARTFDDYQCVGCVETDFPELCALLGVKNIPPVHTKQPAPLPGEDACETDEGDAEVIRRPESTAPVWSEPCLYVELESEDPQSARTMEVSGWKLKEQFATALNRLLPSLSRLQLLKFWQAGLTDQMVISLKNTITLCSNLRSVTLEGNPLPELGYHFLLSAHSPVRFLSLRNNGIGDEGAGLIGSALSTIRSANKTLMSLNLAFNRIGDAGAAHIAKGLRLNRALCFLSLSNNHIGNSGASQLATILGQFALTHEEVVRRRRLLEPLEDDAEDAVDRGLSAASISSMSTTKGANKGNAKTKDAPKKEEKAAPKKGSAKPTAKKPPAKAPPKKGGKSATKDKQPSATGQEVVRLLKVVNPLLEDSVKHRDGQVILTGNATLASLNLAGNRITEGPLPLFLSSLQMQAEGGGLLRLSLQRNHFPPDCESYVKIQELMTLRDPLNKITLAQTEPEQQGA